MLPCLRAIYQVLADKEEPKNHSNDVAAYFVSGGDRHILAYSLTDVLVYR